MVTPPTRDDWLSMAFGFATVVGVVWFVGYGLISLDAITGGALSARLDASQTLPVALGIPTTGTVSQRVLSWPLGGAILGLLIAMASGAACIKTLRTPPQQGWGARAIWAGLGAGLLLHLDVGAGIVHLLIGG